jgi:phage-related protein
VEFGWPVGLPSCRPLSGGLFEVRGHISDGRIARVLFGIGEGQMILLHGFIKKTQKTPHEDLELARKRLKEVL